MSIESIARAARPRQGTILPDRQGVDIANTPLVEIARRGMVDGMGATPIVVGRESEDADNATCPVVDAAPSEQSTMTAIVLQDEKTNQEASGRNRQ